MNVLAIDPGYRHSAFVQFDGARVLSHGIEANEQLLSDLRACRREAVLVIEEMQLFTSNYGVGREIFDSVFWSGRFAEAWRPRPFERLLRSKVRGHLGASKGGDAAVRASLVDRFGPYKEQAIGKKATPGPLFGIRSHEWSALAIAVTWWDLHASHSAAARGTQ
jgi:hypothetical protein